VIQDAIRAEYLYRQKLNLAAVHREVVRKCKAQGLPAPARNTVASRIARLPPAQTAQARGGSDAARSFRAAGGISPSVLEPLRQVQIDHTVVDVTVVDERDRQPIGRPGLRGERD
jgi:putative transposase